MLDAPEISGAADVISWFGQWPTFHDAEVLSITLDRSFGAHVAILTRVAARQALVTFHLEGFLLDHDGICNTRIEFFNHQNVLSCAQVNRLQDGYELVLYGIFGADGSIFCERMSVAIDHAGLIR